MNPTKIELRKVRDFNGLLSVTFEFLRQNFKLLFKSNLLIAGPFILLSGVFLGLYQSSIFQFSFAANPDFQSFAVPFLLYLFFAGLSYIMLTIVSYSYVMLYREREQGTFDIDDVWQKAKSSFWIIFLTGLGSIIIIVFGSILLIIPGVYLAVAFSLIYMVRIEEKTTFFSAMQRCTKIVSGNWWFTFGFIIVLGFIQGFLGFILYIPNYIVMFALAFAGADGASGSTGKIIFIISSIIASLGLLLYVISIIGVAFHYYNLVERKEAPGLYQQIESIK